MNHETEASERGRRASFDRDSGEVHGSGSNAGGSGTTGEDYDTDSKAGSGAEPVGGPNPGDIAEQGPRPRSDGDPS